MLDQTYRVLCTAFGSLASRAEHVNILGLVLLKWTQVLAHTLKVYRQLRKTVEEKTGNSKPSEVEITKEFLLAGKLHKAVTFGLDVPSLLFADPEGKEFGTGTGQVADTPTRVLEERLFGTTLLAECELDYNRVVSSRLLRALLPRSDSASNVVMTMVVDIFAAFVLQPVMNLWTPTFLNELIVNSLSPKEGDASTATEPETEATSASQPSTSIQDRVAISDQASAHSEEHEVYIATRSRIDSGSSVTSDITRWGEDTVCGGDEDGSVATGSMQPSATLDGKSFGQCLVAITSMSLTELNSFTNLEAARRKDLSNAEIRVKFEDPKCQEIVRRIVMIVEAALIEGRVLPQGSKSEGSSRGFEANGSIAYVLMELTSNMSSFQKKLTSLAINEGDDVSEGSNSFTAPLSPLYSPDEDEISTIRTLIATWLQTGKLATALGLIKQSTQTILKSHFRSTAFLLSSESTMFLKQLSPLEGVSVTVETMGVLASPKLQVESLYVKLMQQTSNGHAPQTPDPPTSTTSHQPSTAPAEDNNVILSSDLMTHTFGNTATPRFLDFHKNSAFASSLRAERDRRLLSWASQPSDDSVQVIVHRGASKSDIELQNELHSLARTFYNSTNILSIRDGAKKNDEATDSNGSMESGKVSLITVETVAARRKLEIPDDDSSFLLRAQVRNKF